MIFKPPTPMPTKMRRMASTIQPSFGVNTEARVNRVKRRTHQEKAALRPMRSARRPQAMAPIPVPSPDMAMIQPASKPFRCHAGSLSRLLTAKPMRNMSKNSDTLPMMTSEMRFFWFLVRGRESICSRAVIPAAVAAAVTMCVTSLEDLE